MNIYHSEVPRCNLCHRQIGRGHPAGEEIYHIKIPVTSIEDQPIEPQDMTLAVCLRCFELESDGFRYVG